MVASPDQVPAKRRLITRGLWAAALVLAAGSCAPTPREEGLLVFAAASLRDALNEIGVLYEDRTGTGAVFNFAGSNVLAQQILAAPDADVFLSADELWMDRVESAGLLEPETRRLVVSNRLVVIANGASSIELATLEELASADFRYLVIGDTEAVPAGRYARAVLTDPRVADGGLWERLADRIVPAADARAALGLVEATPGAIGIVYLSDARAAKSARTLLEVPPELGPRIRYVGAALRGRPELAAARAFLDFLASAEAGAILESHGFSALP